MRYKFTSKHRYVVGFFFVMTGVLRNEDIISCFSGLHLCLKHTAFILTWVS